MRTPDFPSNPYRRGCGGNGAPPPPRDVTRILGGKQPQMTRFQKRCWRRKQMHWPNEWLCCRGRGGRKWRAGDQLFPEARAAEPPTARLGHPPSRPGRATSEGVPAHAKASHACGGRRRYLPYRDIYLAFLTVGQMSAATLRRDHQVRRVRQTRSTPILKCHLFTIGVG